MIKQLINPWLSLTKKDSKPIEESIMRKIFGSLYNLLITRGREINGSAYFARISRGSGLKKQAKAPGWQWYDNYQLENAR